MCTMLNQHRGETEEVELPNTAQELAAYIESTEAWLTQLVSDNETFSQDNAKLGDIVSTIEASVIKHSEGYDGFRIGDFSEWLDSLGNQVVCCVCLLCFLLSKLFFFSYVFYIPENLPSINMVHSMQKLISSLSYHAWCCSNHWCCVQLNILGPCEW